MACHYCGTDKELRPYGPNGSDICFPCMKKSPLREIEVKRQLGIALGKAGPVAVLTNKGPKPVKGKS